MIGLARALPALLAAALAACAAQQGLVDGGPTEFLAEHGLVETPAPARFSFCLEHGCQRAEAMALTPAEWRQVAAPLADAAAAPEAERQAVAASVARFETAVRTHLGLKSDQAGTYPGAFSRDQNDCVDETANTTTLLMMLDGAGLLRFHRPGPAAKRGVFVDMALPHRTATLVERDGGAVYVVDSWFRPSGEAADVAPLEDWLQGWTPPGGAWS